MTLIIQGRNIMLGFFFQSLGKKEAIHFGFFLFKSEKNIIKLEVYLTNVSLFKVEYLIFALKKQVKIKNRLKIKY